MTDPGISATLFAEDIGGSIDWAIQRERHVLIVHLGGHMDALETELDGSCTSIGPAVSGECWLVPAGARYASAARGGAIRYAEVEMGVDVLANVRPSSRLAAWSDPLSARLALSIAEGDPHASMVLAERLDDILAKVQAGRDVRPLPAAKLRSLYWFIEHRLEEVLTLQDMASHVGCSVNGFIKAFTASIGETPAQYLIRQRLRRAQHYLAHSGLDITSIALQTGFSSHAHMSSTFKMKLGQSPSSWRQTKLDIQNLAA